MKTSFSSLLLAVLLAGVFCRQQCITPPEYQYKGCSNQIGNYVLDTVNKYCATKGPWCSQKKFDNAKECFKNHGLNLQEALDDCTPEITRKTNGDFNVIGYKAACPEKYSEMFLQYHMNCCLINHSLEFSKLTYDEALEVHNKCNV